MEITLQYFDGCPNWQATEALLTALIAEDGLDATIRHQLIDSPEAAVRHGFRGSPTVLVDGVDPFPDAGAPFGLSCRVYQTEHGPAGSPTRDQLRRAIGGAPDGG